MFTCFRYVYIVDIAKGVCIAALTGQSDCVSSIRFSPDCRYSNKYISSVISCMLNKYNVIQLCYYIFFVSLAD